MKKKKKAPRDPRLQTPPGYFLRSMDWTPEKEKPLVFFSIRDTAVFAFLILACLVVAAILWLKPPKYISFDADAPAEHPAVTAKNMPKQLQKFPGYDTRKFEEISDDDPSILSEDEDLPLQDVEPEKESMPRTIKSEIKKVLKYLIASLRLKIIV